jgi:glycosyltransferase involved in cell wall biosynthesis
MVSVIMPVFNAKLYLSEAVESILSQTFADFELITIDDCSTDGSLEILKSFAEKDKRVLVLDNERNLGVTPTLNRGLATANGELIARMDADDISLPERLEKQAAFLKAHPEVGLVSGDALAIDAQGSTIP